MQVVSFVGRLIELYILSPLEVISTILRRSAIGVARRCLHRDQALAEEDRPREAQLARYLLPIFSDMQRDLLFPCMSIYWICDLFYRMPENDYY